MRLKVTKTFSWAYRGCDVVEHSKGEIIETLDEDLIRVAVEEGWARPADDQQEDQQDDQQDDQPLAPAAAEEPKAAKPAANKALKGAPENK